MTCHVLHRNLPLCRFTNKDLSEWPEGTTWVDVEDAQSKYQDNVTCPQCRDCVRDITTLEIAYKAGYITMADLQRIPRERAFVTPFVGRVETLLILGEIDQK